MSLVDRIRQDFCDGETMPREPEEGLMDMIFSLFSITDEGQPGLLGEIMIEAVDQITTGGPDVMWLSDFFDRMTLGQRSRQGDRTLRDIDKIIGRGMNRLVTSFSPTQQETFLAWLDFLLEREWYEEEHEAIQSARAWVGNR